MKLFGRRKAIAAGTVTPAEVFSVTADQPPAVDGLRVIAAAPADGGAPAAAPVAVTPAGPISNGAVDAAPSEAGTVTPAETSAANGREAGGDAARPVLRFSFGDADADVVHTVGEGSAPLRPADPVTAPVPSVGAGEGGEGSVATKPRKVISIGFDDDLDAIETTAFDPSPVDLARPDVEPRLRARRIQVRRDEGRKRLRWAVVGVGVLLLLAGAGMVLESPLFAIDDVEVTGVTYTNQARLQQVIDDLDGATLLGADLGHAEATLAADPWVKRVRVERRPLRGVRIEIVERTPIATYMGVDQRWRVLDPAGRVLAVLDPPGSKPVDPLELKLAQPGPNLEPSASAPATLAVAADLVPRLPASLRAQTCSMSIANSGGLKLNLCKNGYVIDLGQPEQLRDKLITVLYVLTSQAAAVGGSRGMNVSDPFHPVLIKK